MEYLYVRVEGISLKVNSVIPDKKCKSSDETESLV